MLCADHSWNKAHNQTRKIKSRWGERVLVDGLETGATTGGWVGWDEQRTKPRRVERIRPARCSLRLEHAPTRRVALVLRPRWFSPSSFEFVQKELAIRPGDYKAACHRNYVRTHYEHLKLWHPIVAVLESVSRTPIRHWWSSGQTLWSGGQWPVASDQ